MNKLTMRYKREGAAVSYYCERAIDPANFCLLHVHACKLRQHLCYRIKSYICCCNSLETCVLFGQKPSKHPSWRLFDKYHTDAQTRLTNTVFADKWQRYTRTDRLTNFNKLVLSSTVCRVARNSLKYSRVKFERVYAGSKCKHLHIMKVIS